MAALREFHTLPSYRAGRVLTSTRLNRGQRGSDGSVESLGPNGQSTFFCVYNKVRGYPSPSFANLQLQ